MWSTLLEDVPSSDLPKTIPEPIYNAHLCSKYNVTSSKLDIELDQSSKGDAFYA